MTSFIIDDSKKTYLMQRDPVLGALIAYLPPVERSYNEACFISLISAIVYQQISISAGNAIWNRLETGVGHMTPHEVLQVPIDLLRSYGLSNAKANTVHAIADAFSKQQLTDAFLKSASHTEVIESLTHIKGIGTWTAEMFLIFSLGREDVFSLKDLGLRNGIQWLYGLSEPPTKGFVDLLVKLWHPYATIAAFYLWEITLKALTKSDPKQVLGSLSYDVNQPGIGHLSTPIGDLVIYTTLTEVTAIHFMKPQNAINETPLVKLAKEELFAYFKGDLEQFTLPLSKSGTSFQQSVYKALQCIPYGTTISYGELACAIDNPKASRAVGGANNKNPLPILVPCHRVVGSKGQLVGYAGGLTVKEWLLNYETSLTKRPHKNQTTL
jgi:DNA-3-methyladenine glycosylase II